MLLNLRRSEQLIRRCRSFHRVSLSGLGRSAVCNSPPSGARLVSQQLMHCWVNVLMFGVARDVGDVCEYYEWARSSFMTVEEGKSLAQP